MPVGEGDAHEAAMAFRRDRPAAPESPAFPPRSVVFIVRGAGAAAARARERGIDNVVAGIADSSVPTTALSVRECEGLGRHRHQRIRSGKGKPAVPKILVVVAIATVKLALIVREGLSGKVRRHAQAEEESFI